MFDYQTPRGTMIPSALRTGGRWIFSAEELERWIKTTTPRRFTEGFDTADVKEAEALLDKLNA